MTHDAPEVLSALFDGEPVDPAALEAALASPHAIDVLRDFARLRSAMVVAEAPEPALANRFVEQARRRRRQVRRATYVLAAAALAALAVGIPLMRRHAATAPPAAERVVRFTEGVDWFQK